MVDKITLKKIITDFQRYSNNLMNTSYEEADANFRRFKKYIDENQIIKEIVQNKIKDSNCNYKDCFLIQNSSFGEEFSIPNDEADHMKAIYDYMDMIENSDVAIFNIAVLYRCKSNQFVDILQNFNEKVILPIIDYINIELSKKLLEHDEFYPAISFYGNNSPVYFQSSGNQNINYTINDIDEINKLIDEIIRLILETNINDDFDKDELKDDLEIIKEALNTPKPNVNRVKRIFDIVSSKISNITTVVSGAMVISNKLEELWNFIEKIVK